MKRRDFLRSIGAGLALAAMPDALLDAAVPDVTSEVIGGWEISYLDNTVSLEVVPPGTLTISELYKLVAESFRADPMMDSPIPMMPTSSMADIPLENSWTISVDD